MPSAIWVYRHAESLSNAGAKTLDPAGIPLTTRGCEQAGALAAGLKKAPDLIVTSPFLRTIETAAPIVARFPETACATWPIQEFTYLEPMSCIGTSWVERKPRIDAYWGELNPAYRDGPNAETFADLLERARAFLADLAKLTMGAPLFVSHGQFMRAAEILCEQPGLSPLEAMQLFVRRQALHPFANCERLTLVLKDGVAHLGE